MPKRELRTFEYKCDGYTTRGLKCISSVTVTTCDGEPDADKQAYVKGWILTAQGWLCRWVHRDDPRNRGGVGE